MPQQKTVSFFPFCSVGRKGLLYKFSFAFLFSFSFRIVLSFRFSPNFLTPIEIFANEDFGTSAPRFNFEGKRQKSPSSFRTFSSPVSFSPATTAEEKSVCSNDKNYKKRKTVSSPSLPPNFFEGKKVLLRCDLNVPYKVHENVSVDNINHTNNGYILNNNMYEILDATRIYESLKTINYLREKNAKIILVSHLGRVKKEGFDEKFSLFFIKNKLEELLANYTSVNAKNNEKTKIKMIDYNEDITNENTLNIINNMNAGDVVMFDNIRFYKGETKNDEDLGRKLGSLCDIFVNDAFGASHRQHASLHAVTRFVDHKLAGLLLNNEIIYLQSILSPPPSSDSSCSLLPFVGIIGGSKISTKIEVIKNLMNKVDKLILGGAMVFPFFEAKNIQIGKSFSESGMVDVAKEIEELARRKGVELILPVDLVTADKMSADEDTKIKIVKINEIDRDFCGLDNGPETTKLIIQHLQDARTILWNGPLGVSEIPAFSAGTNDVAKAIAELTVKNKNVQSILGGGDTISAVNKLNIGDKFTHVSTGGGATLELLEKGTLPAIEVLDEEVTV